jgi:tripartite-type tricarboxylate transporter receptor subunit TctC
MKGLFASALVSLGLVLGGNAAQADDFPGSDPIVLIVPASAGGAGDFLARILADDMTKELGTKVVVEFVPGAGGRIAMRQTAAAKPNGHTLIVANIGPAGIAPSYFPKEEVGYDIYKDFVPVSHVGQAPLMLVVNAKSEMKTFADLIATIRKGGKPFNFGSSGAGQSTDLAAQAVIKMANAPADIAPYPGGAQSVKDLLGGQIDALFDSGPSVPLIRDGSLRAIAVASAKRSSVFPDVPSINESGFGKLDISTWWVALAPAGTPAAIVDKLSKSIDHALQANKEKLTNANWEVAGGDTAEAEAFLKSQVEGLAAVIAETKK